jgi:NADPH:quinone reductase-like Zn-dependent oxidoreductase
MKAIAQDRYGSPEILELREMDKPTPKDDEVLVRVQGAAVNAADWHYMRGVPYVARLMGLGVLRPKNRIRGLDFAGTVEAVGQNVTQLQPGDEVYGERVGAFAEYICAPGGVVAPKPANLTFEHAAAVPLAANTALQGLRDRGGIRPGQKVLIYGASGGVGTFAVQLAKFFGAEVTGVCSTRKVDMVRSIGADHVIDHTQEDFTRSGQRYDLIFDGVGNRSLSDCRRALTEKGTLVMSGGEGGGRWLGPVGVLINALVRSRFMRHRVRPLMAAQKKDNLLFLKELIETGRVRPVIHRAYPLREVPDAIRYVEEGHPLDKVVITV